MALEFGLFSEFFLAFIVQVLWKLQLNLMTLLHLSSKTIIVVH